ncbi:hypothetical protein CHS0354_034369 [Potamilus streckersoni]|uniref:DNA oxidative demethylase ALKBH2 n=1 Tax=Potamilus streckersoni TaxID=2493646 RepID=A0AAE0WG40_9BIVA|nr:hypothetical protein CHS0354_034369 [Potamilus streckersoni]
MDRFLIKRKAEEETSESNDVGLVLTEKRFKISSTDPVVHSASVKNELESETGIPHLKCEIVWREIRAENLNCDYTRLFSITEADDLLAKSERTLTYNTGHLAKVNIFGKWQDIPRKQVAHGDDGLSYTFSNKTLPARPWIPFLEQIRDRITAVTGYRFNFVLINRYQDGNDHIGEHRDDEKDLVRGYPIASLSLGQARDFIFKHAEARGKNAKRKMAPIKILLEHGSLLLMKHPTNVFWYHSLPIRKGLPNVRINMTFRKMVVQD